MSIFTIIVTPLFLFFFDNILTSIFASQYIYGVLLFAIASIIHTKSFKNLLLACALLLLETQWNPPSSLMFISIWIGILLILYRHRRFFLHHPLFPYTLLILLLGIKYITIMIQTGYFPSIACTIWQFLGNLLLLLLSLTWLPAAK